MKKLYQFLVLIVAMLTAQIAFAIDQPTFTTLSAAVADEKTATFKVTSATGFTASTSSLTYMAYVDYEAVRIRAVSGTTITVERGQEATRATAHVSGARIFVGLAGSNRAEGYAPGPFVLSDPYGACTRGVQAVLPIVNVRTGQWHNCLGGQWVPQTRVDTNPIVPLVGICNIPIGSVAYGSVGTNSADVADKMMRTSIVVPRSGFYTGIQVLQGGTATTDKIHAGLFDSTGKLVTNSLAAGVLLATADTFKALPFAAVQLITGPARYFIGVTGNGATAGSYRTIAASTFIDVLSGSATSQTFGTFPEFTPPTTFSADLAPVSCLYN